jgi:hypothetical protein
MPNQSPNKGKRVKSANVGNPNVGMFDPMPKVKVTYQDGTEEELFSYYPDEISFSPHEFVGLTREQACELRTKKDVSYLRSK